MLFTNGYSGNRGLTHISKGDSEIRQVPFQLKFIGSSFQCFGSRSLIVWCLTKWILLNIQHLLNLVIVGIEIGAGYGPIFIATIREVFLYKPLLIFANHNI